MTIIPTVTMLVALLSPPLTHSEPYEQSELRVLSIGHFLVVVPVRHR
jgi:hypothetical protein